MITVFTIIILCVCVLVTAPQIDYTNTIDVYNHNTTHVTVIYNTKVSYET